MVKENLRVAQSRQKSYADHRRMELSFEVGDFVYLKVSPMRGLRRFKVLRRPHSWDKSLPSCAAPRRTKPHRETGSVATAPLALARSAMAPPHQPIRAAMAL
jgi:hypothetical protein